MGIRASRLALAWILLVSSCGNDESARGAGGSSGAAPADAAPADAFDGTSDSDDATGACGGLGHPCCLHGACDDGLGCTNAGTIGAPNFCFPCGKKGQPCCILAPGCGEGLRCAVSIDGPGPGGLRCYESPEAGPCISECRQPGGQYCGRISDACGKVLECGQCDAPGFTCGGAGIHGVCGAPLDSGACDPTVCETPSGKYCRVVGDGCGSRIDCGACDDGVQCGLNNVCNAPTDGAVPRDPPPPLPPLPPPPPT